MTNVSENLRNAGNFNMVTQEKYKLDFSRVRIDHMNPEEKAAICELIKEYSDFFHVEGNNLTFTNQVKHTITTTDEIPVYTKSYRYPEIYKKEVNR